jgi:hypothetical protein
MSVPTAVEPAGPGGAPPAAPTEPDPERTHVSKEF